MNAAFVYFYDEFLSLPRYERDLSLLENELAVKGISGAIVRLTIFRDDLSTVKDRVANGAKNLIFVGNDATIEKMMRLVPDNPDLTLGFLPLVERSAMGRLLGMPSGAPGADVVAARLVETVDLGRVGDRFFLTECVVTAPQAQLEIEGAYRLAPLAGGAIAVRNLGSPTAEGNPLADPKDGRLEAVIQAPVTIKNGFWNKQELTETRIPFTFGRILSKKQISVFVDGKEFIGTEFPLGIAPRRLKIITGRNRRLV